MFICSLFILLYAGCNKQSETVLSFENISFRDIPGITDEETKAIEAVLAKKQYFTFAMTPSTEAFLNTEGEIRGLSALICEWLSSLFEIPFELSQSTWNDLLEGLRTGAVDFTIDLTPTPERREIYFMTESIVHNPVLYYRISGNENIIQGIPRYAILEETTTIDAVSRYAI